MLKIMKLVLVLFIGKNDICALWDVTLTRVSLPLIYTLVNGDDQSGN